MQSTKINLTRDELYNKVWTTPIRTLAKEFGLSDVGLAKLCRRHQIPVPGLGYWARLQSGQKLKQIALPVISDVRLATIEICPHEQRSLIRELDLGDPKIPRISVAEDGELTHPLALRVKRFIPLSKVDEKGLLLPRKGRVVPIEVSPAVLSRALRILDALFTALEATNYAVKWQKPCNTPVRVRVLDEELPFSISEILERKEHKPTREEGARQKLERWWQWPKWDYQPTGRLKITVDVTEPLGVRRKWSDGRKKRLEDHLGHFMLGLIPLPQRPSSGEGKNERSENANGRRSGSAQRRRRLAKPSASERPKLSKGLPDHGSKAICFGISQIHSRQKPRRLPSRRIRTKTSAPLSIGPCVLPTPLTRFPTSPG